MKWYINLSKQDKHHDKTTFGIYSILPPFLPNLSNPQHLSLNTLFTLSFASPYAILFNLIRYIHGGAIAQLVVTYIYWKSNLIFGTPYFHEIFLVLIISIISLKKRPASKYKVFLKNISSHYAHFDAPDVQEANYPSTHSQWTRTPNEAFFHQNPKLLGLGRQFG